MGSPRPNWALRVGPLVVLALTVVGISVLAVLDHVAPASVPRSVRETQNGTSSLSLTLVAFAAVGFLILRRQPRNSIGWVLMGIGLCLGLGGANQYTINAYYSAPGTYPAPGLVALIGDSGWSLSLWLVFAVLPFVFPDGRTVGGLWRWFVRLGFAAMALAVVAHLFDPQLSSVGSAVAQNPIGIPGAHSILDAVTSVASGVLALLVVPGIASLVTRYRRGGTETRLQLKWFIAACAVFPTVGLLSAFAAQLHIPSWLNGLLFSLAFTLAPIAIGVAVVRHRLYDIDVVINRALVYGALAAFITAVYVGIVVGIGSLVGNGGRPNLALSVVATAVVAVAFQPVRERVQRVANRLVYGKRATPYEVLSEFSARVAESYAGEQVLARMAQVLAEGTGAEVAEVWLRSGRYVRVAATWPAGQNGHVPIELPGSQALLVPGADRTVPVRHQDELLGALSVKKRAGESLTPIEEKLLEDLANQAGLVLKNVGLTADLQARLEDLRASRQRLVAAQDEERRRLERNLHDGAQQHLVALKVKLGLAERLANSDPARAAATIGQLKDDADEALETLRDLARGIYPPLLAEKGLRDALISQARKATIAVVVEANGVERYSHEVEAAVYFCCLEALQNVQKYAAASEARVVLSGGEGVLGFCVEDDGVGFDPAVTTPGSGLTNLADRLDALGGTFEVDAAPGRGTRVRGSVPVG